MNIKTITPNQKKIYECGDLLRTQQQQLKTLRNSISDPNVTYEDLCNCLSSRIDGMLTINHIVHRMLMEIDDNHLK